MSVASILRALAPRRRLVQLTPSSWLAPLLLAGCLGGQTGTEGRTDPEAPGAPTDSGGGSSCDDEEQPIASDDASLGFAFDDVSAFVMGEHTTELGWQSATPNVSFGPESGVGSLVIGIDQIGGVKRIHSVPRYPEGGMGPAIGILCPPDRLAADVTLHLTSGGGALSETVAARVVVESADRAQLAASIPLDQVQGSFEVSLGAGTISRALLIRAAFTESGLAGDLRGSIETSAGGAASQSVATYARFPAENPCDAASLAVPVPLSSPGASELSALVSSLRDGQHPLTWKSGDTTSIRFEVTPAEVACQTGNDFTGSGAGLSLPLALALRTLDGRVDTMLAGSASTGDGGPFVRASRICEGADVTEQADSCGIKDVDPGANTDLSLLLSGNLAAGGVVRGSLEVLGVPVTDCQSTPQSSCGRPGPVSIETGLF